VSIVQLPFVNTDTSREAAESMKPHAATIRSRVLATITAFGIGVSDQQLATLMDLPENTVRPRRVELERAGLIRHEGYTTTASGRRARCWVPA
jgi:hypothetical protein